MNLLTKSLAGANHLFLFSLHITHAHSCTGVQPLWKVPFHYEETRVVCGFLGPHTVICM